MMQSRTRRRAGERPGHSDPLGQWRHVGRRRFFVALRKKEQRMTDSPNKTVLLVDDSPCIRHVCGLELQREGYQVVLASHGREALAMIGQQPIDLIILDMQMRPTSGFEVLARVRVDHPDIPIIAHTALSEREVARRSVQIPDAHVQKGGDFSVMKSLVAQLLSSPPAADHAGQARMASCTTSLS